MKVAFTTSTGISVDEKFRKATSFTIWDVGPREAYRVNTITIEDSAVSEDGRIAARADAVSHCAIVCSQEIGGPAAAKLVARNIHPMRTRSTVSVEEIIGMLQKVLREKTPPWLRQAELRAQEMIRRGAAN
jgi:nitrogen fixation protein NifX